jgi:hypothetical protein
MNPALRTLKNTIRKDIRAKLATLSPEEINRQCKTSTLTHLIVLSISELIPLPLHPLAFIHNDNSLHPQYMFSNVLFLG